jgi:lipopolysaccharide export system permease protein
VNRELVIPKYQDGLSRNAQNWLGQAERPIHPSFDKQTGINISGTSVVAKDRRVIGPVFRLAANATSIGHKLEADAAVYHQAGEGRPAGYWLRGVTKPLDIAARDSIYAADGAAIILTSQDTGWLADDECFVASLVPFSQLTGEQSAGRFAATSELISALRNPSLESGANLRIVVHSRFVQPFLDASLFLMGISLVLTRHQRNVFVAAGLCLLVVNSFYLMSLVCQVLGSNLLLSPALAAWSPLFLFGPAAIYMATPIWD